MANYKGIKGYKVQSRGSDPTANEGQIWYNTASSALKYDAVAAGAWGAGGGLNNGMQESGGVGSPTAAICAGGSPPPTGLVAESYNGTSWTVITSMSDPKIYQGNIGTQTTAMMAGSGNPPFTASTEVWNGASWTELNAMNTGRGQLASSIAGTPSAAIVSGGANPPSTALTNAESFNGTTWTAMTVLPTAVKGGSGAGTQTSYIAWGGYPATTDSVVWNGSSWTEITAMTVNRRMFQESGTSDTSAMAACGTYPPGVRLTICEQWNGTSWTEVADTSATKEGGSGGGTTTSAWIGGGYGPGGAAAPAMEIWDGAPAVVKTVTVS